MIINNTIFNTDLETIITDLQTVLRQNGSQLLSTIKSTQTDVMIPCPYHKDGMERRPSMGISKETGISHCFTCNAVVSLPELISYCFGDKSKIAREGWKWLLRNYATMEVEERQHVKLDFGRNDISMGNRKAFDRFIITGVRDKSDNNNFVSEIELDKYRYYHPYWAKRGITDENIIELFDLGYDKDTKCITMPVRDVHGNCLFIARRSVQTKWFNYPQGVEKPLYGLYELYKCITTQTETIYLDEDKNEIGRIPKGIFTAFYNEIIVCESMIDAITSWQRGRPCVALNGLGTALQFKQLRELPCRKLILATDMDEAGLKARERIKKNVTNKIIMEYLWDKNVAKDINDMSKEMYLGLKEVF